jgi:hypothetical protein
MLNDTKNIHAEKPRLEWLDADIEQLSTEKREHFMYVMRALVDCYKSEQHRAIVLIADAVDDPLRISLLAINADEKEVEELTETLSVFRRIKDQSVMN